MKHSLWWHVTRIFLAVTGLHSIKNNSTCEYDLHDYPVKHGGDGTPSHFYQYTCPNCGKKFSI